MNQLKQLIRSYASKVKNGDEPPPAAETNRQTSNHTSSNNDSSNANIKMQEQLRKRQQAIEKLYRRSVVNKIYIFPRDEEPVEDLLSVSSHDSIEEMHEVTTYRLYKQVKKMDRSYDRLMKEYHSQHPPV